MAEKDWEDADKHMAKVHIWIPLEIEDVNVLKDDMGKDGSVHIELESTLNYAYCRKCGQRITKLPR